MVKMKEKTFKQALSLLKEGLIMLGICTLKYLCQSTRRAIKDTALGIYRHPIVAIVIVGVIVWQFYIIAKQRAERDAGNLREYRLEQSLDSTNIVNSLIQYRYEHTNDSTGSKTDY